MTLIQFFLIPLFIGILSTYLWETRLKSRVSVSRIKSPNSPDVQALLNLYASLFPENGINYTEDEILEMLLETCPTEPHTRHTECEEIILVAKAQGSVIGFIFCHYYPLRKKAIISYFGIEKTNLIARQHAAKRLLNALKKILTNKKHACDFLFFDLEGHVRPTKFKLDAHSFGLKAYHLMFPYSCPKISLDHSCSEKSLSLMCVPLRGQLSDRLPRKTVMEFLTFILLDCYGDLYSREDQRYFLYQKYLNDLLLKYKSELQETIPTNWHIHSIDPARQVPPLESA